MPSRTSLPSPKCNFIQFLFVLTQKETKRSRLYNICCIIDKSFFDASLNLRESYCFMNVSASRKIAWLMLTVSLLRNDLSILRPYLARPFPQLTAFLLFVVYPFLNKAFSFKAAFSYQLYYHYYY